MDEELGAPVRVRLVFADRHLLSKEQRSHGLSRSWAVIRPELATVADLARDISSRFGLRCSSGHDLVFSMDGFIIPSFESTSVFRENDIIRVQRKIGKDKKKAVAIPDREPHVEGNKIIDKQIVPSNNGILLIENGVNPTQKEKRKMKKKRAPTEMTSTKRKHKEMESPKNSKKKKLKLAANERPVIINESNNSIPAIGTPCENHTVNQNTIAPVVASERNKEVVCTGQNTSPEHQGGENELHDRDDTSKEKKSTMLEKSKDKLIEISQNLHGAIQGNGTYGAGLNNGQEHGPRTDETMTRSYLLKPGSNLNGPDAPNPSNMWNSRSESDGQNERNSPLRISDSVPNDEVEESDEDDIDFDSLNPLTCLPVEGDTIAYRLVETSSGRPELSFFRVGKVIKFNPITMLILLGPVPKYPIFPDGEISESQKSMYKEDGTLEIDFGSLIDLRMVEESTSGKGYSKSKANAWENGTGSHSGGYNNNMNSAWKAAENSNAQEGTTSGWGTSAPSISRGGASWQGMGQRGSGFQSSRGFSRGRGRCGGIRKSVNSAWQAGEASNAKEATDYGWGTLAPNNSRGGGASNQRRGRHGNRFGSHGSFSSGMNDRAGDDNNNSAWTANVEATNANGATQTQENGWDTWAPNTSRAGASWSHMGQNASGYGSRGGFSRGGRRGRGGRYSNPKFSN